MSNSNLSSQGKHLVIGCERVVGSNDNIMRPEPLLPEVEHVHSHKLGTAHAYACYDRKRGFDWCAVGGQSTSHSEALRTITGSDHAVHPTLGWSIADLETQAACVCTYGFGPAWRCRVAELEQRYGVADVGRLELELLGRSHPGWGKLGRRVSGQIVQFEMPNEQAR